MVLKSDSCSFEVVFGGRKFILDFLITSNVHKIDHSHPVLEFFPSLLFCLSERILSLDELSKSNWFHVCRLYAIKQA